MTTVVYQALKRDELDQVWSIDRSEHVSNVFRLRDGVLVKVPDPFHVTGWPPGERERQSELHRECYERGGVAFGAFVRDQLVGVAVLDNWLRGPNKESLQLVFLHVSDGHRERGIGRELFERSRAWARRMGAQTLYVSATPTENTVNFYANRGCVLAEPPDEDLLKLEPEDIHFVCEI